ncbi:MAG: hypothetical protein AAFZ63_03770 [Bacteroidota bacterium]
MRLLIILLFLFLTQANLDAQRMFQHPVIQLLGPELMNLSDHNSELLSYQGLGTRRFCETSNFLRNRQVYFHWTPFYTSSNGFGAFQLPFGEHGLRLIQAAGQTDLSGGYSWTLPKDIAQSVLFQSQWRQQWQDDNQDGFNDYQNGRHHQLIHNLWKQHRRWIFSLFSTYLNAEQHQGQARFKWSEDRLSDSIYGYGNENEQWRTLFSAQRNYSKGRLYLTANLQGRREEGAIGQRELASQENRQGVAASYEHEEQKHRSQILGLAERQRIEQAWDNWQDQQKWFHVGLGLRHQRFLSGNWLVKASARLDRHTFTGWQLLPGLKGDYLGIKDIRLSISAGRDYRLPRLLEDGQDYLVSQRAWNIGTYGTDQIWFIGAGAQSDIYHLGEIKQQFKLTYRLQDYQQRYLIDPSIPSEVTVTTEKGGMANQHLFMGTLQTHYRNWKWTSAIVWQDTELPYQTGEQQRFFTSRLASFNSLTLLRRINRQQKQAWDFRLDHLWRSPQPLPNGEESPHLHDLRIHLETGRTLASKRNEKVKVFTGVENLLDQRQEILFQNPDNPFASNFDGSSIWGNALGRRWYAGIRLELY